MTPARARGGGRRGFTLIELLVTLAILGVLGTLVLPVTQVTVQRRQEQELRRALRDIRQGIDAYKRAGDEGRLVRSPDASGYRKAWNCWSRACRTSAIPSAARCISCAACRATPSILTPA